jgi:hypothetical protein
VESSSFRTLQHIRATRAHVGLPGGRAPSALASRHHGGTDTCMADVRDPRQFTLSTTASLHDEHLRRFLQTWQRISKALAISWEAEVT